MTLFVPLESVKVFVEVKSIPKLKLIFWIIKLNDKRITKSNNLDLVKIEKIQEKVFLKNINSKKNIENVDEIEKIDISEEMDRINSHLDQISKSIKSPQLSGKKINFILQEINRESNTILSKFLDKRVSRHAISLKMQAEKLREQIGNILWRILL